MYRHRLIDRAIPHTGQLCNFRVGVQDRDRCHETAISHTLYDVKMALHFTTEAPEDQFYTDFGNLNKFPEDVRVDKSLRDATIHTNHLCRLSKS